MSPPAAPPPAKPLLILDLDETLVYATERPPPDRPVDMRVGPFAVYRRPHLTSFVKTVAEAYDLAVWSSASPDYVRGITAALFPGTPRLRFAWASDRCTPRYHPDLQERFHLKNLSKVKRIGYPLERVLIVDDSPEKVSQHYGNHVRVCPFTGDADDDELLRLQPFLIRLATASNFRTVEKRHWRHEGAAADAGG